jgi:hypothetical protein
MWEGGVGDGGKIEERRDEMGGCMRGPSETEWAGGQKTWRRRRRRSVGRSGGFLVERR